MLFEVRRVEYQKPDGSFAFKNGKREKKFFPYRIDPRTGKGIWKLIIDGVPDVPVVPFGLPELIKNPSAPVFVVEGEAKVHSLRKWGLVATCNAGGAKNWTAEHAEFLRARDVMALPDNDEPGREHAEMVAQSLIGIAKEMHVLELPGLGPKEDVIDWIKRGNILDTFKLLVEQSKPWEPRQEEPAGQGADADASALQPETGAGADDIGRNDAGAEQQEQEPKKPPRLQWADTAGWDDEPCPDRDWAVHERVPLRQVTLFSGEGAIGKSIAELMLGVAHVTAKDWLGSLPEPGGAFYLGGEDDEKRNYGFDSPR